MCLYDYPLDLPPTIKVPTEAEARWAALGDAVELGNRGQSFFILDTRSMEPALWGGDYIVVETVPYADLKRGDIITYWAGWMTEPIPVTHRLVEKDAGGWILSGDNNPRSEPHWRVTEANYIGKVVRVYRPENPTKLSK